MSFSRWSNSCWYTYSDVNGGFTICDVKNFSDDEMRDINKCIEILKQDPKNHYTEDEYSELREYMEYYAESLK